nr:hypothetical protein [Pseudomonas sp.]
MSIKIKEGVAVDHAYYWLPMSTCPTGVKVQLANPGGVAIYGTYNGRDTFWRGWAPCPKFKREEVCKSD